MPANPTTAAAKWAANLAGATQRITDGVNAVQVAPGLAAARQKAVWVQNVAASQDKWASRVAGVSLQSWQQSMITKGVPRIASGATAAQPKMEAFLGQLIPFLQNAKQALPARGTLDQNIARSAAMIRATSTFNYKPVS